MPTSPNPLAELVQLLADNQVPAAEAATIATPGSLRPADLPTELRTVMQLDCWPVDVQQDLLAVMQKIARLVTAGVADAAARESAAIGEEGLNRPRPGFGTRLGNAFVSMPTKSLLHDAAHNARKAMGVSVGRLHPHRAAIAIGAFGATLIGGSLGHIVGTMQRR